MSCVELHIDKTKSTSCFKLVKMATLCLDGSSASAWHGPSQHHDEGTWEALPTAAKGSPHMLSACWLLFLHSRI